MNNIQSAIDIIKEFEGCKLKAYKCPAGVWTCGWGNTIGVTEHTSYTQEQADQILIDTVTKISNFVKSVISIELTNNQYCACISLAFNIGIGAFKTSTLLKCINQNRLDKASIAFMSWIYVKKQTSNGLIRRRKTEQTLFNLGV